MLTVRSFRIKYIAYAYIFGITLLTENNNNNCILKKMFNW